MLPSQSGLLGQYSKYSLLLQPKSDWLRCLRGRSNDITIRMMNHALEQPVTAGQSPSARRRTEAADAPTRLVVVGPEPTSFAARRPDALIGVQHYGLHARHVDVLRLMFHEEGYRRGL